MMNRQQVPPHASPRVSVRTSYLPSFVLWKSRRAPRHSGTRVVIFTSDSASFNWSSGDPIAEGRPRPEDSPDSIPEAGWLWESHIADEQFDTDAPAEHGHSTSQISAFLDEVYEVAAEGDEEDAMDGIFDYMNHLLVEGQFKACDQILDEVDIARVPPVLMVSLLTITAAAKDRLSNREKFFQKVWRVVAQERGEERAQCLLDGLG